MWRAAQGGVAGRGWGGRGAPWAVAPQATRHPEPTAPPSSSFLLSAREHVTAELRGHTQEVCGLAWDSTGRSLASGGNDNVLNVWDAGLSGTVSTPRHSLIGHTAAVKAVAWCPFQAGVLASGGGAADGTIRFWNAHTGAALQSVQTGSLVCALQWSTHERELLSSHGYSHNQLCLWSYPSMAKVAEFSGHSARVLHLAASPDGRTVASAAADETLRFWPVFGEEGGGATKVAAGADARRSALAAVTVR